MTDRIIAYNIPELEKKIILTEAENYYKSKLLGEEQWQQIKDEFAPEIYTPKIFIRILFFIFSLAGMLSIIGPIAIFLGNVDEWAYQFMAVLLGVGLLLYTDRVLIRKKSHYKSGITEAGIYSGLIFLYFGLLSYDTDSSLVYYLTAFVFSVFASIRYLNLTALALSIVFLVCSVVQIMIRIGGMVQSLMPFIFMVLLALIFWFCQKARRKYPNLIFENHFILIKSLALGLFYLAGNYYIVRELSKKLLHTYIPEQGDIPFAYIFYAFTAIVPVFYIFRGIRQHSILFIRVGVLTVALSAATFKYYFSLGHPEITLTLGGIVLITIALVLFRYLKVIRRGFTREMLLQDKWSSKDLTAIIASQTLGGNKISEPKVDNNVVFQGGQAGGAGAGGSW